MRFNTVNPPGNERPAIEHLAGYLRAAGFETELLAADDERPNLVADLRGAADGPTLCFLGHVDTVLADAGGVDPRPVVRRRWRTASCGAAARST